MMHPILSDLKKKAGSKLKIIKEDIDKKPSVATIYQIQAVPTLIMFKNGEIKR